METHRQTDLPSGLTAAEVALRRQRGEVNLEETVHTKSVRRILFENVCTLFNLINLLFAVALAAVGSYKNMLFMGVVVCNLLIGVVQELRAKRSVDRLSLVAAAKALVRRDGQTVELPHDEVVLDDVLLLRPGMQIAADSVLLSGECDVNESFITGEADAVEKRAGDRLFAGSFVVSGTAVCRAVQVGGGNYISKIAKQVKKLKPVRSEILTTLKRIIRVASLLIPPVGALLFANQFVRRGAPLPDAIIGTVAALIGMIPEGLILLTSTVLAVAVVRLSHKQVLVQELYCVEALARVDTLCLDKTGTITEGRMEYCGLVPFSDDAEALLTLFAQTIEDQNPSLDALRQAFGSGETRAAVSVPFDSARKWSGVFLEDRGSILLGAAEFVCALSPAQKQQLDDNARTYRVILLAHSPARLTGDRLPPQIRPVGLVLLRDRLRDGATETVRYFEAQGVTLKVISGDSAETASAIAQRAGISGARDAVNANDLSDEELTAAATRYTVFGRVTPPQKKRLVLALQDAGHTVAMTGDGVNDVMALRQADCSIAMASGSEAARNVSELVLVDSDFSAMPEIVAQGRQSINNIQRSASLFLVKTIYSTVLAVLFILLPLPYPFVPIQLSLISALTIGAPSFLLALEPNRNRIRGHFLRNILTRAAPGGLTTVLCVLSATLLGHMLKLSDPVISTLAFIGTAVTGLSALYCISRPMNRLRLGLLLLMTAGLTVGSALFGGFFALSPLPPAGILAALGLSVLSVGAVRLLTAWLTNENPRKER